MYIEIIRNLILSIFVVFGTELEKDIASDCSGDFERVLIAMVQGNRQKGCDHIQARIDAEDLLEAGEE